MDRNTESVINDFCRNGIDNVKAMCDNNNNASEISEGMNIFKVMAEGFSLSQSVRDRKSVV